MEQEIIARNPHVQELVSRFSRNEELDSDILDRGEKALMGAIYMDTMRNPNWEPPEHIEQIIMDINARLEHWERNR